MANAHGCAAKSQVTREAGILKRSERAGNTE